MRWPKGTPMSPETRAKLRQAQLGRKISAETRAKMSAAKKGRKLSAEHRAKLSAAHKARWAAAFEELGMTHSEPTDEAYRKALNAAGIALCFGPDGGDCDMCLTAEACRKPGAWDQEAATAIAAFLQALPAASVFFHGGALRKARLKGVEEIVAAVKRLAGGDRG